MKGRNKTSQAKCTTPKSNQRTRPPGPLLQSRDPTLLKSTDGNPRLNDLLPDGIVETGTSVGGFGSGFERSPVVSVVAAGSGGTPN